VTEQGELSALSEVQLAARFAVRPSSLGGTGGIAGMAGRFAVAADGLHFVPRFPFAPGTEYVFDDCAGAGPSTLVRPVGVSSGHVVEIYPTAREVPLNLLRLYVYFSAPMSEGCAAESVTVADTDTGEPLADALLTGPELWDRGRTRLSVLLDPGRIKRGLAPHTDAGYPLTAGRRIRVTINPAFTDAEGAPLVAGLHRDYRVGEAQRGHLDAAQWTYSWPPAASAEPVIIAFDRTVDQALALRCLQVVDPDGLQVAGTSSLPPAERGWRFAPDGPWRPGNYTLVIDPILEDLAGNSLVRVFDRDLDRAADNPRPNTSVTIAFTCR
jgi:hypothetical protein